MASGRLRKLRAEGTKSTSSKNLTQLTKMSLTKEIGQTVPSAREKNKRTRSAADSEPGQGECLDSISVLPMSKRSMSHPSILGAMVDVCSASGSVRSTPDTVDAQSGQDAVKGVGALGTKGNETRQVVLERYRGPWGKRKLKFPLLQGLNPCFSASLLSRSQDHEPGRLQSGWLESNGGGGVSRELEQEFHAARLTWDLAPSLPRDGLLQQRRSTGDLTRGGG